ncbi:MAG: methyltransferase domain-containing protein [Desulfobulbaceae bacterium]|nr:methyltransferase domain-containing protein [Desulfobulbaceae bacterium]
MNNLRSYWDDLAKHGPEASVVDPNDKIGHKNRYISLLRNKTLIDPLKNSFHKNAIVLDFGCGSGAFSFELARNGFTTVGLDISSKLLQFASDRKYFQPTSFVQYDGSNIPFSSDAFDACVTYGVLIYFTEGSQLSSILGEIYRVLSPGSIFVAVEQIRRRSIKSEGGMKIQRSKMEFKRYLENAGFHTIKTELIRRGHFPLIYLIRYGLLPKSSFPFIVKFEKLLGQLFPEVFWDYGDVKFTCMK